MLIKIGNHEFTEVWDGVLSMKVKDEVVLKDWVHKIIIPAKLKEMRNSFIPCELQNKVIHVENNCKNIWDWSEKVYGFIENSDN